MKVDNRNVGIDLLKVVSVYMVIVNHVMSYSHMIDIAEEYSCKWVMMEALNSLFIPFLDCFALITGYLMYKKTNNMYKFAALHTKVVLYSIIGMICYMLLLNRDGGVEFDIVVYHILPTFSGRYWYWTAYVIVFLLAPYMCKCVEGLSSINEERKFILRLFIIGVGLNLLKDGAIQGTAMMYGYSAAWLCILFCIGALMRKTLPLKHIKISRLLIICNISIFITFLGKVSLRYLGVRFSFLPSDISTLVYKYDSLTVIIAAICLLEIFSRLKLENQIFRKIIFFMANASFGVYILHNHNLIRESLMGCFTGIIKSSDAIFVIWILGIALGLYVLFSVVDWVIDSILISKVMKKTINMYSQFLIYILS